MGAWENYWASQPDIRHRLTPEELMAIYGPTYQATSENDTGTVADWWNGQNTFSQGGLSFAGRLPWESIADSDQQAISDWFSANVMTPARTEWGADKTPDQMLTTTMNSEYNPFWQPVSGEIMPDLWRRPDTDVGVKLAALPTAYGFGDAPNDITQIDMLTRINPDIAAKYGITPEYARSMTDQNVALQAQRRATHQGHLDMEGKMVLGAIGAMAGAGAMNALGGASESAGGLWDTVKGIGSNIYDAAKNIFTPASIESADPLGDLLINEGVIDATTGAANVGVGHGLLDAVGTWVTNNPTSALNIAKTGLGLLGGAIGSHNTNSNSSNTGGGVNTNPNFSPFTPNLFTYNWRV